HRRLVVLGVLAIFGLSLGLVPLVGSEFFPPSDENQFRVFVRGPVGTRVEETEKLAGRMEQIIRENLRPGELKTIISSVGVPSGRSAIFSSNSGPHAAQVEVYLTSLDQRKRRDVEIVAALRSKFAGEFPGTISYFNLGGIVSRVLNRGSQNPLELEVLGYDLADATSPTWPMSRSAGRRTTRSSPWSWTGRRRPAPGSTSSTSRRPPCSPSTPT
ncbi:MAG: efflux RND transporter permease subunit, partial [Actinobacteria bacterium]